MTGQRGSSKLELLAAVMLIAAFAAILLNRLAFYQEMAEKAKVEYTISILKSALRLRMATMLTEGRSGEYALLARQNPMDWLEDKPLDSTQVSNAAGPVSEKRFAGQWEFNPDRGTLTYWPVRSDHLQEDASGLKRIRLHVEAVHSEPDDPRAPVLAVRLRVEPYHWLDAEK